MTSAPNVAAAATRNQECDTSSLEREGPPAAPAAAAAAVGCGGCFFTGAGAAASRCDCKV